MLKVSFAGQREDRNNVDKLRLQTNALNFNNQRNIKNSIDNLSKDSSTKNINFLMNVAEQIRYGLDAGITSVKPNNDWKEQLRKATEKSLANNNTDAKEALQARFKQVFENNKELTDEEKNVLSLRESLLKTRGLKTQIRTSENENVRNIEKNLNNFVVSSEISTDEKVQVLEKLNKFMSSEYKIDKQLKDKKPQVLGEMLNDMVVKSADQDRPTIKQVDQRHHGMCADISFARKAMAYEYKPQYVDIVMQEVSADNEMEVYDISKIGTGAKIKVSKTPIDYAYAEEKGYRIIDASTLQWMNVADKTGDGTVDTAHFSAFDREYFDTFHDGHYYRSFSDPKLEANHNYLRAIEKADEKAKSTVKTFETRKASALEQKMTEQKNAQYLAFVNRAIAKELTALMPKADDKEIHSTVNELIRLNQDKKNKFYIVDAEEDVTKKEKIAKFIESKNPAVDKNVVNEKMDNIFNLYSAATETLEYMNKEIEPKTEKSRTMKYYKPLYEVAATYRTSVDKGLDVPEVLSASAKVYGLDEKATKQDVLKAMEKEGLIVSEDILRGLQTKYNKIAKYAAVVEKAEVKGDVVNIKGLYAIDKKEADALEVVHSQLKEIKDEVSKQKNDMQEIMAEPLRILAKQVGLEEGSYWVQEGSSGLNTPREIRIYEQMTGQRFYKNEHLDDVANTVKKSNHSGISTSSVYHNEHGWHAMYIADVAPVQVKDPVTGKMVTKDAIMHDNSWGYAEKKNNWIDSNGLERTDYACGRGGAQGYITNSLWQNGLIIDDVKNNPMIIAGKDGSVEFKSRMLTGAILPSSKTLASKPAAELVNQIIGGSKQMENGLNLIEKSIKEGQTTIQDINLLNLRYEAAAKLDSMAKQYNNKVWAGIKSEADWNKLDDNDSAKLMMERVAVAMSLDSQTVYDYAMNIKSADDIKKADKAIYINALKDFENTIRYVDAKDFNLNEYEIDVNADYGRNNTELVKNWIDKVFDPADNEEFIQILHKLKAAKKDDLAKFIKEYSTKEDLGINRKTGYETLVAYKNANPHAEKIAKHFVWVDALGKTIGLTKDGKSVNEQYLVLRNKFGGVGLGREIKKYEKMNLEKYGARAAFPEYDLYNEQNVRQNAQTLLAYMAQNAMLIKTLSDNEQRKANIELVRKGLKQNIDANIDRIHRNRVMNTFNKFMTEVAKNPESKEVAVLSKQIENDFAKYSIAKDIKGIFEEYLTLTATNENPELAKILRNYLTMTANLANAYDVQSKVMDAISKGNAHEFGQEIMNLKMNTTDKEGNTTSFKLADKPEVIAELTESTIDKTGALTAATMFNSMALGAKAMEAMSKVFNFENIMKLYKPQLKVALLAKISNVAQFLSALNLKSSPAMAKAREQFMQDALKTIRTIGAMK